MSDQNTTPQKYRKQNDVVVRRLRLVSQNGFQFELPGMLQQLTIIEDLTSPFLNGNIILTDPLNLPHRAPIIGQEYLEIEFYTPGTDSYITKTFWIYKISERALDKNKHHQTYKLHFVSIEMKNVLSTKISKSFTGTYAGIASRIYEDFIRSERDPKFFVYQRTDGEHKVVIPGWNPLKTMLWLAGRSSAERNRQEAGFLFYEDLDSHRFRSVYDMIRGEAVQLYQLGTANMFDKETGEIHFEKVIQCAENFKVDKTFDRMEQITHGQFAGSVLTHDTTFKEFSVKKFDYLDQFDAVDHLEDFPVIPQQNEIFTGFANAKNCFFPKTSFAFDNIADNNPVEDRILERQSALTSLDTITLKMMVPGDTRRRVGQVVEVEIPDASTPKKDLWEDPLLSGRYLVTQIAHQITTTQHKMTMKLARESLAQPLPDENEERL